MDSFSPIWLNKKQNFPGLTKDIITDILVVGGGITGVAAAYHAAELKKRTVLIEKKFIASGTTGRGTGILDPGFDMDFSDMVKIYGSLETKKIWNLSLWALKEMRSLIKRYRLQCDFKRSGVIVVALSNRERELLKKEALIRQKHGYDSLFLSGAAVRRLINAAFPAVLYSPYQAILNQKKFVLGLAKRLRGVKIFERTPALSIKRVGNEYLVMTPKARIKAQKVIIAVGVADSKFIKPKHRLYSYQTFEIATRPLSLKERRLLKWRKGHALYPLGRYYDYVRFTKDNRLLVGGEDSKIDVDGKKREKHFKRLIKFLEIIFPQLGRVAIDYKWSGVVQATKREFPEVGRRGNVFYGFAYGGHGLLMAFYVGGLLAHLTSGKPRQKFAHSLFHKGAPLDKEIMARLTS